MNYSSKQLAMHIRQVHFGENWTAVSLQGVLEDVNWKQAIFTIDGLNSIVALTYHIGYYIEEVTKVLEGKPLMAKDKLSFNCPLISSEEEWRFLVDNQLKGAERFAQYIEILSDDKLKEYFQDKKYGTYFRNLLGIIEHTHYHLGQIVLIKKMVSKELNA